IDEMDQYPEDRVWEKIQGRIKKERGRQIPLWKALVAVASVLVVALGIWLLVKPAHQPPSVRAITPAPPAATRQEATGSPWGALPASGDKKELVITRKMSPYHLDLPDGSKVLLNVGSK